MKLAMMMSGLTFLGLAVPALADDAACYANADYLVVAQERTTAVGTDFLIRAPVKGKIKCEFVSAPGDFVLDDHDEPLWFAGLAGHYLAVTRSTGPDGDLVIYDLDTRSIVIDVPADDDVSIDKDQVVYWERVAEGSADTCAEFAEYTANGLGAVIAQQRVFSVASGEATATGASRCSATQ